MKWRVMRKATMLFVSTLALLGCLLLVSEARQQENVQVLEPGEIHCVVGGEDWQALASPETCAEILPGILP